ncbi:hypothetical protein VHUM_03004 [Vanrija humicola]|uniref:J domain-containing protein n=1 Tax=Vanrija humicola TaxID=5417 RepID=A0A7D8V150_VANHU|nr:hypothetical protein VHUM_03004 [Vanrija humicola]
MDDAADPILTFFSAEEAAIDDILYTTLGVKRESAADEIRKAYRKAALLCHPDKHSHKSEEERGVASVKFQRIGFSWAVLSDEKRRKRYDATGRTDELKFDDAEGAGWDAYFDDLFERVDRKMLDDDKAKYQGSEDELEDLRDAYIKGKGNFVTIMSHIPHSAWADEARFIVAIEAEIKAGNLERTAKWTATSTDERASANRRKSEEKSAAAAEKRAKELGVHDEFYGSGKKGKRNGEKKEPAAAETGLAALIRARQGARTVSIQSLEAKYRQIEEDAKARSSKKRKGKAVEDPPDLDDEAFAALQAKMFGDKAKSAGGPKDKKRKAK